MKRKSHRFSRIFSVCFGTSAKTEKLNATFSKLRLESLEERQMLSVTPTQYQEICDTYSELGIPQSINDVNIIEETELTAASLQNAVHRAQTTKQSDLIVLKFDADHSSINLNKSIKINFDVETSGSLTIVCYGASLLQISSEENEIFSIQSGAVNLGGFSFIGRDDGTESNRNLISVGEEASLATERVVYFKGNFGEINAIAKEGITGKALTAKAIDSDEIHSLSAEFNTEGTEWAYVTGLTLEEAAGIATAVYSYSVSDYFDVNKNWVDDSGLCWAATASNMLKYAGYGGNNTVQQIFNEFKYCFANDGGDAYNGCCWYLSGDYGRGGPTIEHAGGGHHPTVSVSSTVKQYWSNYYDPFSSYSLSSIASFLKNGEGAVGIGIMWKNGGGHNATMWGYYYDTQYASTNPNYYTKLIISCSDDDLIRKYATPIVYLSSMKTYCFTDYGSDGTNSMGYISDFVTLKKNTTTPTLPDLTPYKPSGWSNSLIVTTTAEGTTSLTSIDSSDRLYFRGAWENLSNSGVTAGFNVKFTLTSNNPTTFETKTYTSPGLEGHYYTSYTWNYGTLAAGTYTLKMEIDSGGIIAETNEYNNSYSCSFTVESESTPNQLTTPTLTSVTAKSSSSISVTIGKVTNASGYQLEYSTSSSFTASTTKVKNYNNSGTQTVTGLSEDTTYYFRVKAVGDGTSYSDSNWSSTKSAQTLTSVLDDSYEENNTYDTAANLGTISSTLTKSKLYVAPKDKDWFKFTIANDGTSTSSVKVTYDHSSTANLNIYLRSSTNPTANLRSSSKTTGIETFSLNALPAGTYYLLVQNFAATQTASVPYTLTITPPAKTLSAPTISASVKTATSVNVSISRVTNATGYQLQYSTSSSFATYSVKNYKNPGIQTVTNLTSGKTYYFRVKATSATQTSAWSNTANAKLPVQLSTPTLSVRAKTSTSASVTIGSVANATGYQLQYSTSSTFATYSVKNYKNPGIQTVTNLASGKTYYFRVKAVGNADDIIDSDWTAQRTLAPTAASLDAALASSSLESLAENDFHGYETPIDEVFTSEKDDWTIDLPAEI